MSADAHQQQRYRVIDRLASGGMAEVFVAESAGIEGFKKRVAIKRVLPTLSNKKRFISMFLDEARLSAHLSHSNCVQTFDIGVGDNAYFIVMEYVDGADLKAVIDYLRNNNRQFPVEIAVLLTVRICEGLTYAHELTGTQGEPMQIVHRDMSPPNILITKYGEVKIVDFGLAKASSQLEKSEPGIIKGKFSYLSPEAALGGEVDHRTDIFATGIILWELLAGKRLFLGDTDFATVKQVQQATIPPLSQFRKDVPEELERIIRRSMAKDVSARYSSARDLGRDLTAFLYKFGRPVSSFDIAELVRGAMALRKKSQPDKSSIIDRLIEEALFEFTSLTDDKKGGAAGAGAAAAKAAKPNEPLGFEDIGNWALEMENSSATHAKPTNTEISVRKTISGVEIGNLAALEDDGDLLGGASGDKPKAQSSAPPPALHVADVPRISDHGTRRDSSSTSAPIASTQPEKKGGNGALIGIVVVLLLAGIFAGLWFGNVIPH
ncbi:MAG: serine/threonine-protein kinase [Polyangiaceae bacterium]